MSGQGRTRRQRRSACGDALTAAQDHEQALRTIAFKANELAEDGLMAKGTGSQIRDLALAALGARGDEAIRIIRGDYERTVRT